MKTKNYTLRIFLSSFFLLTLFSFNNIVMAQCSADAGPDVSVVVGYPPMSCTSLTATPTGTPPFSFSWSTGDTSQTINVCPVAATNYWVTITDSTGCSATDTVSVTVVDVRCGSDSNKISVCHIPPGNPAN